MRAAIGTRLSSVRAKEQRSAFLPIKASLPVRRYTDRFALRLQLDEPAIYPLQRSCERRFKNLNPPPDAAPPPIRDVESTQNGLPVEFLDHEALADTEAAACLRSIPARRRASPIRLLPVRLNSLAPLAIALSHPSVCLPNNNTDIVAARSCWVARSAGDRPTMRLRYRRCPQPFGAHHARHDLGK